MTARRAMAGGTGFLGRAAAGALPLLAVLPALLFPQVAAAVVEAHLFQQDQCGSCHLHSAGEGGFLRKAAMRRDVNALCHACHEAERRGVGHRVGMAATMPVPEDFPLDPEGRLTCATCHDPHAVEGPYPHLLRRPPGKPLCDLCHAGGFFQGEPGVISVHFPPAGAAMAPGETVVGGSVASRSVDEVTVRAGTETVTVPVVRGGFAARLRLRAGQKAIAVTAGGASRLVPVSVRAGSDAWRPHLTADTGQCEACHPRWRREGFFSPAAPGETCYQCHPRLDRMPHAHRPAALGECTSCHDPHGGGPGLVPGGAEASCGRCHDRDAAAAHVARANADPAAVTTACGGCHDPHQSTRPALTGPAPASPAISFELEAPEPEFDRSTGSVTLRGFRISEDPGRPRLPERLLPFAVPPGADARSARLRIVGADTVTLPGLHRIPPAPPAATWVDGRTRREWGRGRRVRDGADEAVYGKDAPWPPAAVSLERGATYGDVPIVRLAHRPLQFNPARGTLTFTRRAVVEVSFEPEGALGARRAASPWRARLASGARAGGELRLNSAAAAPAADYAIVTTRAIAAASGALRPFAEHKATRGFTVRIVTEDEYGAATGPQRAHAVRRWLAANAGALGLRFVLLVGSPHPESGDLPMLRAWPRRGATTNPQFLDAPTDAYFADLTGDWDLDRDGFYGEFLGDGGAGGVDFVPEVYVGRIPVYGDVAALDEVLRKTIAYETEPGDPAWRRTALLPMSFSDPATDGAWLAERMKEEFLAPRGFSPWSLYQQGSAGGGDSAFASDEELRGGAAQARWAVAPPGIVAWWGHGSSQRTAIGYSGAWDGDILAAPVSGLSDAAPAFVFQTSCLNGYPELAGNLGAALLRRGAIATVAASRVSWYYIGQTDFAGSASNAGLGYGFLSRLTAGEPAGQALALAKGDPRLAIGSDPLWMNLMDFNLYGDPSVGIFRGPLLRLSVAGLAFTAAAGEVEPLSGGAALEASAGAIDFEAATEGAWLTGAPLAGAAPATLAVSAHPAGLAAGEHEGRVVIRSAGAGNSPLALPVTLRVVPPGRIAGRVAGADGAGVAGATVTLQGPRSRHALTDAAGAYAFETLPPGAYTVGVSGSGFTFRPASAEVVLREGEARRRDFSGGTLEIRGRVARQAGGAPIPRAAVQLRSLSGVLLRQVLSAADGSYVIRRVAPGAYRLRARHEKWVFAPVGATLVDRPLATGDLLGRRR